MPVKLSVIAPCLLISTQALCQEYNSPVGRGKINKDFNLRAELGWQKSWYASLGVSYLYSNVNSHVPEHFVIYAAAEANLAGYRSPSLFYAYKAGAEFGGTPMALGIELRNCTDFAGRNEFVGTPRIGLSLGGYISLFYGYNLFDKNNNVFGIGRSQLSLNMNLNRKLFTGSFTPEGEPAKEQP